MPVTLVDQNPPTQNIYMVRSDSDLGVYFHETTLGTKQAEIVKDIIEGQYPDADQVICVNLAEGTSKDVTNEFLQACCQHLVDTGATSEEYPDVILGTEMWAQIDLIQSEEASEKAHIKSEAIA